MKVCIVQPPYSTDYSKSDEYFEWELNELDKIDESVDLIVLPESSDIPCIAKTEEEHNKSVEKYNKVLFEKVSNTAKRCNAVIFYNARFLTDKGYANTTYAVDKNGEVVGKYFKAHPVPKEIAAPYLNTENAFNNDEPYMVVIDGIKYAFLTCYDFYFYENFANIARYSPDVIIGCSHQRSDTHLALEIITQFLAYNTNTYVIRSSVSMGEDSDIGGASMVVAPTGEILANLKSEVGHRIVDINVNKKYYKPAGFGNPPAAHYEYIEQGRKPWKYRPAGSAIILDDDTMPYPRTCAHRGFNSVLPENSLPAWGAAIALGAEEIEFDLYFTKDGEVVSIHDPTLERVSNGKGYVWDYTYEELSKFDFGFKRGEHFSGMKIPTFEQILKKFACQTIMNIHLKTEGEDPALLDKIVRLIKKYDCEKHVYFMTGDDKLLERLQKEYPHIPRCCGAGNGAWQIVERAIKYDCKKLQLYKGYFNKEMVDKAKANGIITNVFWSDDADETKEFLDMGIDCILTNDYNRISQVVEEYKKNKK